MEEKQEKRESFIQINDQYRITSDGRLNLILEKSYNKKIGKGKNQPESGEIGWELEGYFGAGLQSLIRRFNNNEFLETFSEVERGQDIIEALKEMRTYLDEREQRLYEFMKDDRVVLNLKNTKDLNSVE